MADLGGAFTDAIGKAWGSLASQGYRGPGKTFLDAFTGRGIQYADETGVASVNPLTGAFQLRSNNPGGTGITLNPTDQSLGINKGAFNLSGGWGSLPAGSIPYAPFSSPGNWAKLGVQLGQNTKANFSDEVAGKMATNALDASLPNPTTFNSKPMLDPRLERYYGRVYKENPDWVPQGWQPLASGADQIPNQSVSPSPTAGQQLRDSQIQEYESRNPDFRYKSGIGY